MTKNEYQKLLLDERWKVKRLEILKRDNFKCTVCGNKTNLHVHHLYYKDNNYPWEYENNALVTLCKKCHKKEHKKKTEYYYSQYNNEIASELINLTGLELKVLMLMEIYADPISNEVVFSKRTREEFLNNLGITLRTFYEIKYRLKKKGMIINHRGAIIVNPEFFWRGTFRDREILLSEIKKDRLEAVNFNLNNNE